MKPKLILIFISLTSLSIELASCNSSRRAARRIQNIAENHLELLVADTIKIDTILLYEAHADTAVFDPETELETDSCVVMHAAHGTFAVKNLTSRQIQLIYTPDTDTIHFRDEIPVQRIIINETPEWRVKLRWAVFVFVDFLFIAKLKEYLKKISKLLHDCFSFQK